jgi:hypothetical protein
VAFKFFDFLGEETVTALHAGAHGSVTRTREVFGRMDPRRVADRMSSNGHGADAPAPSSGNGHGHTPQPVQASSQASKPESTSNGARRGPFDPWKDDATSSGASGNGWSRPTHKRSEPWASDVKPGTGQRGTGWSKPSSGTSPGGGGGGGAAAGAAGAVVSVGMAAGQKTADVGSRAGAVASQQRMRPRDPHAHDPWQEPRPDGDTPPKQ